MLFISSSSLEPRETQHGNVIEAAWRAGVGFVAYTSILNAHRTPLRLATDHRQTEDMLATSGPEHVVLRNGWYIENHLLAIPHALARGIVLGAAGQGRFSAAARADYAAAAARVVHPDAILDERVLELSGGESYRLADFAAEIARQSSTAVSYGNMTSTDFRAALVAGGMPEGIASILAGTDAGAADGALYHDGRTPSRLIGCATTPFRDAVSVALREHSHHILGDHSMPLEEERPK